MLYHICDYYVLYDKAKFKVQLPGYNAKQVSCCFLTVIPDIPHYNPNVLTLFKEILFFKLTPGLEAKF